MEVFRTETRVGLLILAALVLVSVGIFITSDIRELWESKRTIELLFPYADGITRGSPVWYAGFEVGEVSGIRIAPGTTDRIAVTAKIDPRARVRKDSRIDIRSLGMMGAKYVEITPGSPDSPELEPGETLEGKGPSSLSEILETGQQVATRLAALVEETRTLVHEVRTESSLKEAIQNANGLLVDLRERGKDLQPIMRKVGSFADSLDQTGANLKKTSGEGGKELTALLKELRDTNRDLQKRIENVELQLTKTLAQIDRGFSEAEGFARGAKTLLVSNEKDITSFIKHLKETTRHLEILTEDLRAHPWKVVWKENGTYDHAVPSTAAENREKGRIGPQGKK
ncbi:MAG TPA: MlaD family protein [Syntrophobacteraceae bacterium]|nr:MlaD family protein [Syntrophobacteraceae bacterium]